MQSSQFYIDPFKQNNNLSIRLVTADFGHLSPSIVAPYELGVTTNGLYQIVKHYCGVSPKEYITNRIILEAKRRVYYAESVSAKQLEFELGFNDPDYFSRLFKKNNGQNDRLVR
jgi:methylphosphotriester-DNA--protein-cysteine methyltransferase